jgi:biotin carboxyl carrier protein
LVTRKVLVNGREIKLPENWSAVEVEPNLWSVLDPDGRSFEVWYDGDSTAVVNGRRHTVEVVDPRAVRRRDASASLEGRQTLKASMPGKVVRILVSEGDPVEAGAGVVVVEAMKMQNEVKSPKSGTVTKIAVREGATVNAGEVLAIVE